MEWANGTLEWVRWTMSPWRDAVTGDDGMAVTFESIPDPRLSLRQDSSVSDSDLASDLAQSGAAPVLVLDLHGTIVRSNRKARGLGNWQPGRAGQSYGEVFLSGDDRRNFADDFQAFAVGAERDNVFNFPSVSIEQTEAVDGSPSGSPGTISRAGRMTGQLWE